MPPTRDALQASLDHPSADAAESNRNACTSTGISSRRIEAVSAELLDAVRRGNEEALCSLIGAFTPLVYGVALRITRSEADAEDVLQDVFIGLPEALQRFDGHKFESWLRVVASRRALMLLRSERRRAKHTFASGNSNSASTEDRTLNRIMIDNALELLNPTLRTVFLLKEVDGMSHSEIAQVMGTSENLSQVRLYRARRALRKLIG